MKTIIKKIKILFFRVTLERYPGLYRPSSTPYISGDTFRNLADHVFDETSSINPQDVNRLDIVFLNGDLIDVYFKTIHKKIRNEYILITHNSDFDISDKELANKDKKIVHWFAQNLVVKTSSDISPIPIGLENLRRLKYGRRKWYKNQKIKKNKYIAASYDIYTNYVKRSRIIDKLENNKLVEFVHFSSAKSYFDNITDYKFAICPSGNGSDTHRIWECFLLGIIPILEINEFSKNFKEIGLPLFLVNDWSDLNNLSAEELNLEYKKLSLQLNKTQFSSSDFWIKRILLFKSEYISYSY